jgi:hypothetical protein
MLFNNVFTYLKQRYYYIAPSLEYFLYNKDNIAS